MYVGLSVRNLQQRDSLRPSWLSGNVKGQRCNKGATTSDCKFTSSYADITYLEECSTCSSPFGLWWCCILCEQITRKNYFLILCRGLKKDQCTVFLSKCSNHSKTVQEAAKDNIGKAVRSRPRSSPKVLLSILRSLSSNDYLMILIPVEILIETK